MDHDLFEHLCGLARLRLDEAEVQEFEAKFARLLEMVESLAAWEPGDAEDAASQAAGLKLRQDTAADYVWPPDTRHSYKVPMIIDFEGEG
jgi:Asp-tRNA(Asn)/Glu-tRNA(Gln) amidotransferase C subunit